MLFDGDLGGFIQCFRLWSPERWSWWSDLWVLVCLDWICVRRCNDGRARQHVAYCRRTVPLGLHACAGGLERGFELTHWMVCDFLASKARRLMPLPGKVLLRGKQ